MALSLEDMNLAIPAWWRTRITQGLPGQARFRYNDLLMLGQPVIAVVA